MENKPREDLHDQNPGCRMVSILTPFVFNYFVVLKFTVQDEISRPGLSLNVIGEVPAKNECQNTFPVKFWVRFSAPYCCNDPRIENGKLV